jgi:hypothetical protein
MIQKFTLTVNGKSHTVDADPDMAAFVAFWREYQMRRSFAAELS